ncbi:MAG: tetratricopeptide repeat protein, partial [Pirellulaceae bacterium]|nr:tetratricopeptide repeat protein [Pirellulaceae bacterium]
NAYAEKGDFDRAAADLSKVIETAPDESQLCYRHALARLAAGKSGDYRKACAEMLQRFGQSEDAEVVHWATWTCTLAPDAVADWSKPCVLAKKAAKSDPKSAQYALTQGASLYRAGRVQQAIQRLTETEPPRQASDGTSASSPACVWFYLAMAHHRLGHRAEAKDYLDKAVEWMDKETQEPPENTAPGIPWNRRFTLKLLSDEARALLKTDASQLPESPAQRSETCYLRGRAHADKGELSQALAAYGEAIQLDPSWADYYGARGDAYARHGDLDLGIADFTAAIRLDPSDVEARINRGSVYVDKGELDKAATDFQEALRTNPLCGQDVVGLAERYRQGNQAERATAEYRKAMRLDPQYTGAYLLHSGLVQPGHAKLDQILGDLRQLLRLRNNVTPAWLQWASCWLPAMTRGTDKLPGIVFATDLPWVRSTCGWGPKSAVRNGYTAGGTLRIAGLPYAEAVWTHAFADTTPADVVLDVSGQKFATFKVDAGVERTGSVQFQVLADGKVRYETPVLHFGTVQPVCVDVAGVKEVVLRVLNGSDGNTYDSAGWGFARFVQAGAEDPLEEPGELHSATDANAAFFLAEVHWRLDHNDLARRWYAKAVAWMDKNQTEAEKLRGCREEAAELLGIAEKPATAPEQPEKP